MGKTRLGIDRSKQGSVTKRSERVKKKEKEENLNLKLGGQLKAWLNREGKENQTPLKRDETEAETGEKETALLGIGQKYLVTLAGHPAAARTRRGKPTIVVIKINHTSTSWKTKLNWKGMKQTAKRKGGRTLAA